ncbi:MAG: hypothetical protein ACI8S6_003846 [Myxococcota bacterium]|jgi:hypothetical protein
MEDAWQHLKTQETDDSVEDFLDAIEPTQKQVDARAVCAMMAEAAGPPRMWGKIVGFGNYTYRYESGRTGDWFFVGFAPRKQNLTLYIMPGFSSYEALMARLGKHKTGKSGLYIKKLADVDEAVLKELIAASVADVRERHAAP